MSRGLVRVAGFSISLDGYGAGPSQSLERPLGENGLDLHAWVFDTPTFKKMHGGGQAAEGGAGGSNASSVDERFAARAAENVGAWILGRNMFGPVRGPWPDDAWRGWWGDSPPYHVPTFVLTHHARAALPMAGGTTFHFVTGGVREALDRAREAAGDEDVRIGGGAATIRQYLRERLVDALHIAVSPVLLGRGEHLFDGLDARALGYRVVETVAGEKATHVTIAKT